MHFILRPRAHTPVPVYAARIALFFVTFVLSPCFSAAQKVSENTTVRSDHERQLLEKIDRLERRVAELEARAGISSSATQPDPASTTKVTVVAAVNQPLAATSAAGSSSSPSTTEVGSPFAFADFTWLNGNSRTKDSPLDSKVFTGEFRADI